MRARRMPSCDRSARCRWGPEVAVYPSLKIKYKTWSTERRRTPRSSAIGQLEWNARCLDGLLRPGDSLRHGGFGNQESIGDFSRG